MMTKSLQILFIGLLFLLMLFWISCLNQSNYIIFKDINNKVNSANVKSNKETIKSDQQLIRQDSSIHTESNEITKITMAVKEDIYFKVDGKYTAPLKTVEPLRLLNFDSMEVSLLDSIRNSTIALSFRGIFDRKHSYISKNKECAILVDHTDIKIFNSSKGLVYEGDASGFYEYDDTYSRFYPVNDGQSFVFNTYDGVFFYEVSDGNLKLVDSLEVSEKLIGSTTIDLSSNNERLYMLSYEEEKKITSLKIFDTYTRALIVEKELACPYLFSNLSASPNDKIFTATTNKHILIFNENLDYVKAIEINNTQRLKNVKCLDANSKRLVCINDDSRIIIYDLQKDLVKIIEAPSGFNFSDISFNKDSTLLCGAHKYNQKKVWNKNTKIVKSILVEIQIDNPDMVEIHDIDKGFYRFEKVNDEVFIRVMNPNESFDMGSIIKIIK